LFYSHSRIAVRLYPMLSHSSFIVEDLTAVRIVTDSNVDSSLLPHKTIDHIFVLRNSKAYNRRSLGIWMLCRNMPGYRSNCIARRSSEITMNAAVEPAWPIKGIERLWPRNAMRLANFCSMRFA